VEAASETETVATGTGVTTTDALAVRFDADAVILVLPTRKARISPSPDTLAMSGSELAHDTGTLETVAPPASFAVTFRRTMAPSTSEAFAGVTSTDDTPVVGTVMGPVGV
jgi:hypothetical protein